MKQADFDFILTLPIETLLSAGISSKHDLHKKFPDLLYSPKLICIREGIFDSTVLITIKMEETYINLYSNPRLNRAIPVYSFDNPWESGRIFYYIDLHENFICFGELFKKILKAREFLIPELFLVSEFFKEEDPKAVIKEVTGSETTYSYQRIFQRIVNVQCNSGCNNLRELINKTYIL